MLCNYIFYFSIIYPNLVMPRKSTLRQILDSLTVAELKSIRKEYCPRVTSYNDLEGENKKSEFIDKLRRSLDDKMGEELDYEDLIDLIRSELTEDKSRVTTKIRNAVKDIRISKNAGHDSNTQVREMWICSEIFQSLKAKLEDTDYIVEQEKSLGNNNKIDLMVSHKSKDRNYPIELKLTRSAGSFEKLPTQIARYKSKISYIRKFYSIVVIEEERNLRENKDRIDNVYKQVENKDENEILTIEPSQLNFN